VLIAYLFVTPRLENRFVTRRQQTAAEFPPGDRDCSAGDRVSEYQQPGGSIQVVNHSRAATLLESVPIVAFLVSMPLWFVSLPIIGLASIVLPGIALGYVLAAHVRVEKEIQRRLTLGGFTSPWWSASRGPVRHLRNAMLGFLGMVIVVALFFLPVVGISLILGMVIGSLLTGPVVRHRLLQLDKE
jgi:hypothetical protein